MFRVLFFLLLFLMPLEKGKQRGKLVGWLLYAVGLCIYFLSWLPLIYYPESSWAKSLAGFTAPAWTPGIWKLGIACIGNSFSFGIPFKRWIVFSASILFPTFHKLHNYLVFMRLPHVMYRQLTNSIDRDSGSI